MKTCYNGSPEVPILASEPTTTLSLSPDTQDSESRLTKEARQQPKAGTMIFLQISNRKHVLSTNFDDNCIGSPVRASRRFLDLGQSVRGLNTDNYQCPWQPMTYICIKGPRNPSNSIIYCRNWSLGLLSLISLLGIWPTTSVDGQWCFEHRAHDWERQRQPTKKLEQPFLWA